MTHGLIGVKHPLASHVTLGTCLLNEIESYLAFTQALSVQVETGGTKLSPEARKGQKGDVLYRALNGTPSECSLVARRLFWEQDHAGSIPVTPTNRTSQGPSTPCTVMVCG